MSNVRLWCLYTCVCVLVGCQPASPDTPNTMPPSPALDENLVFTTFTVKKFTPSGELVNVLKGKRLTHQASTNHYYIDTPFTRTFTASPWHIRADNATADATFDEVIWQGSVRINTHDNNTMNTEHMTQQLKTHALLSDSRLIIHTPVGHTRALGFVANTHTHHLELKGDIRAHYHAP